MTLSLPISEQPPADHERRAALGKVYRYLILKARQRLPQTVEQAASPLPQPAVNSLSSQATGVETSCPPM